MIRVIIFVSLFLSGLLLNSCGGPVLTTTSEDAKWLQIRGLGGVNAIQSFSTSICPTIIQQTDEGLIVREVAIVATLGSVRLVRVKVEDIPVLQIDLP